MPKITSDEEISCILSNDTNMTALIDGVPRPTVNVMKDGNEVHEDQHIQLKYEKNEMIINFHHVKMEHAGNYTIVAKNDVGTASFDFKLKTIGKFA